MALKSTCKSLKCFLECIQADLDKAEAGNKAAAQRVRTNTIKFEKMAKLYRKESVKSEKTGGGKGKPAKKGVKKAAAKKPRKTTSKSTARRTVSRSTARKRPTAKLLKKKTARKRR
ncbi:MAG: histone [Chlamydiales bacterium]